LEFGSKAAAFAALVSWMRYVVILEKGANSFGAYVPDLPGCAVVAATRAEALQLIREAVKLHVSSMRQRGEPVQKPGTLTGTYH
jgi:predicted RNase H-like HicB family nuclease